VTARSRGRWRPQPRRDDPRNTAAGRDLIEAVRQRVSATGEPCWFYGQPGYEKCPGAIDLDLPSQHRWAFTTHHTQRIMDGGPALPDPAQVPAAHRGCNSRDGLIAQNARRRTSQSVTRTGRDDLPERTSEPW
jgi:hypothetical protein